MEQDEHLRPHESATFAVVHRVENRKRIPALSCSRNLPHSENILFCELRELPPQFCDVGSKLEVCVEKDSPLQLRKNAMKHRGKKEDIVVVALDLLRKKVFPQDFDRRLLFSLNLRQIVDCVFTADFCSLKDSKNVRERQKVRLITPR